MIELASNDVNSKVSLSAVTETESRQTKSGIGISNPYILLFLIFLIFSRRDRHGSYLKENESTGIDLMHIIRNAIKYPELERVLSSVCPYLSEDEQTPIHTIAGILQLLNTTKRIKENSYRIPGVTNHMNLHYDKNSKHVSIIKVLKEYANESDRNLLEAIESAFNAMDKIQRAVVHQQPERKYTLKEQEEVIEIIESLRDKEKLMEK